MVHTFKTDSLHAVIKQISPLLVPTTESKPDSIIDVINEVVTQNSTKLKLKWVPSQVHYITREFNVINARFYQNCLLNEFRQQCWTKNKDSHAALSEQAKIVSRMTKFVKKTICAYELPKEQARAITLFILVARESLHYEFGPDLMTLMAIALALQSMKNEEAFKLLDEDTLKILKDLLRLTNYEKNYFHYRKLLATAPCALPFLGVMFGDKVHIYDNPLHENAIHLGNLHQSLIAIKRNLQHASLDSQSDLSEQLQKKDIKNNEIDIANPKMFY